MASCALVGGCPTDYIAIAVASLSMILLLYRAVFPFVVHKVPRTNGSGFWVPIIQVLASFFLLLSMVMSVNFLRLRKNHWWLSCYVWAVWVEGPLGFGLLLSCRITQAFQLYNIFVKRRLPPIKSYFFLPLVQIPWIACSVFIHVKQPLNKRCHMGTQWIIPFLALHAAYVAALVGLTGAVRHVEFRFDELKDLWQGILVSASSIGVWTVAYILNEVHDNVLWLQVVSRFVLLVTASVLVVAFFSMSSSEPLLSQISLRRDPLRCGTMGQALGIPDSGLLAQMDSASVDPNEPLDKLLLNRRFRESFMEFADSCLAGESMNFYNEVHELAKISLDDSVRRIYMARHIIENYVVAGFSKRCEKFDVLLVVWLAEKTVEKGSKMEVNISHRTRQEILNTCNLAHPHLFNAALNEVMQLMKTSLAKDYWSSMFFIKFKEEASRRSPGHEMERTNDWNFSPRSSSVQNVDNPFQHDHFPKSSSIEDHDRNNTSHRHGQR